MTIEQIEDSLPNGLHDAKIREIVMDYEHARLMLRVEVLVGLPTEPYPDCEHSRSAVIIFQGIQFYSVELPQAGSSFQYPGSVDFSYERTPVREMPEDLVQLLPSETQCYSLFIRDWLSHIRIAAADVSFSWSDTGQNASV